MEEKLKGNEFAEWLEDVIHSMFDYNPDKMCFVAHIPDGNTMTAYFNATTEDIARFAWQIIADAVLVIVMNNASRIVAAAEGQENEDGDDDV